ncbi:MAG: SAM-dependent methyltransferase [Chloroflexota bacterium]
MIIPSSEVADLAAVAAHYDELDELYRNLWGTSLHHGYWITGKESPEEAVANLTRLVAEQGRIHSEEHVCDLGCGYGAIAFTLNREYHACVSGITISRAQFQYAAAAAAGSRGVEFFHCDAIHNGLASESFDAAIAVESSEHMLDKARFFAEAHRLLRPGGRFVVVAWLTRDCPGPRESKYLIEPICREGCLPGMASATEYRSMLERAGFRELTYLDLTERVKKTWSVCARRLTCRFMVDSSLRRRLRDPRFTNRRFAKSVFRIRLAYETGAMRYGLFAARK